MAGWESAVTHLRRLRGQAGKRPPPVVSRYELPIDDHDADDFGDEFPTYCGSCDSRRTVTRQDLVDAADEATAADGVARVVSANS